MSAFLEKPVGKVVVGVCAAITFVLAGYSLLSFGRGNDASFNSRNRVFICTETGKTFNYELKIGDMIPVQSPYSNKKTGVEAETCYWTKDGKTKQDATFVLLNSKKGGREPTFCPDCGRLVTPLNAPAAEGMKAPPTEAEYRKR